MAFEQAEFHQIARLTVEVCPELTEDIKLLQKDVEYSNLKPQEALHSMGSLVVYHLAREPR